MKLQSKKIVAVLLALLAFACKRSDNLPDGLIPVEQMSPILSELQIAESTVARMNLSSYDSAKVAYQYKQQQVLKSYGVDSSLFNKSYETYARYPAYMEAIYMDVLKILQAKSDSVLLRDRMNRPTDENPPQ